LPGLTDEEKTALLKLARSAITAALVEGTTVERPADPSSAMKEKRGCFVTLHKRNALRGCIGTIEPVKPLYLCVEDNAIHSAFEDPRFPALTKDELAEIDIEISVLTVPKILDHRDPEELLERLKPGIHGVILSSGWHGSTFLPQVWTQLPDKKDFLKQLCLKGGMPADAWKDKKTTVKIYEAEYFSE